ARRLQASAHRRGRGRTAAELVRQGVEARAPRSPLARPSQGLTAMAQPLAGIRVLAFPQAWAGPTCTRLLADYGADVIKVESRRAVDIARVVGPFPDGPDPDTSGYFLEWNRNKRSVELDLRAEDDLAVARRLAT